MKNDTNYSESNIEKTSIDGLLLIRKAPFEDFRGYFREALKLSTLEKEIGKEFHIKTWNYAISNPKVLRGIHSETAAKLIYPIHGKGFIAVVDIRPESKTFGKYEVFETGEKEQMTIFKDEGMGVAVLSTGETPLEFMYLMDKEYDQLEQKGLLWNDPDVNIKYPILNPIISDRDKNNPTLRQLFPEKYTL
ncbi:MAG: dTDP-4-dehydrorhamnose 3,5-epimerase family protein [Patescibacteria group bacterium]